MSATPVVLDGADLWRASSPDCFLPHTPVLKVVRVAQDDVAVKVLQLLRRDPLDGALQ